MTKRRVKEDAVEVLEEAPAEVTATEIESKTKKVPEYLDKEDVHFDSRYKDLRVFLYEEKGDGKYREYQVQFRNHSFRTNDQTLIKLLENNRIFGGTASKDFEDQKTADPLYWRGGYPQWYVLKRQKDADQLTRDKEEYES